MMPGEAPRVRIEIDIFSGRLNPKWELDVKDAEEIVALLRLQRQPSKQNPEPQAMGFRGFIVDVSVGGTAQRIRVKGHLVGQDRQVTLDPDRTIEKFILKVLPNDLRKEFIDVLPR
jgi:hypothetical protein